MQTRRPSVPHRSPRLPWPRLAVFAAVWLLAGSAVAMNVGGLRLARADRGYELSVATAGKARPRLDNLSGRVLILVPGGRRSLKTLTLASGPVARMRFGRSGGDLRIVLDLREALHGRILRVGAKGFVVLLEHVERGTPKGSNRASAGAAGTPAPAGKAPASEPAGLGALSPKVGFTYRVVDLTLGGDDSRSELVVSADGPADYTYSVREDGRLLRLVFRDSSLAWSGDPAALRDNAIASVRVRDVYREGESSVVVEVRLTDRLGYALRRDQNQVVVSVKRPAPQARPAAVGDMDAPVSLDVQGADLVGVLKALCDQAGFNYQFTRTLLTKVPPDSLVTMKAKDRPFHEVVDTLLSQVQCRALRIGNTIYMGSVAEIDARRDVMPAVTRTYQPRYLTIPQIQSYLNDRYAYDPDERTRVGHIAPDPRDPSSLLLVGTASEIQDWMDYIRKIDVPEGADDSGGGGPVTRVFHLNYLDNTNSALIDGAIAQVYPTGVPVPTILIDPATRTMVITTYPRYMRKIRDVLRRIDIPPLQVNIEGKIVEVDQGAISEIGVNWTSISNSGLATVVNGTATNPPGAGTINSLVSPVFASNFTLGTIVNRYNIASILATINALVEDQKAEIVTDPNVTTVDNQSATLGLIQTQVYEQQTSTITNGVAVNTFTYPTSTLPLTLVVTPKISSKDRNVLMNINFQLTSPSGAPLQLGAPVPTEQEEAITNVEVPSGDTYIIGGLVTQDNNVNIYKVPILGDIPLIGLLFRYNSTDKAKRDIIVFIKPTIVGN